MGADEPKAHRIFCRWTIQPRYPIPESFLDHAWKHPSGEQDIYDDLTTGRNYSPLTDESIKWAESALLTVGNSLSRSLSLSELGKGEEVVMR